MGRADRLTVTFAALLTAVSFSALAQQPPPNNNQNHKPPPGQQGHPGPQGVQQQHLNGPGGPPPRGVPPHGPGPAAQFHPPGPPGVHPGPGGPHPVRVIGERGYSFHTGFAGRREIVSFSPREREIWGGGRWHHEERFGRYGYWYEVNGAWYFYDQPYAGPPPYVADVEFFDEGLEVAAPVVVAPAPVVVAAPPVVVVRPPPIVCVGPLCVR